MEIVSRSYGVLRKLTEVGKKISAANAVKLRKALQEISDLLAQVTDSVSEAERSAADKQRLLQRALQEQIETEYCYIDSVYDADLVYYAKGRYWRAPYTLAEDGSVTFGDRVEVIPQTVYNPAPAITGSRGNTIGLRKESADESTAGTEIGGDVVPLVEAVATNLQESATARIKLIAPGWGSSGYYPASTLQAAARAGVFGKGLKMYWNHPTAAEEASRPEGDLDRLAGELVEDASWDEAGAAGPGLYAKAKVFERYAPTVGDMGPHIGTSIRAFGSFAEGEAEGRRGPIVQKITSAKSVDFVTVAGAGGKVLELFESAGRRAPAQKREENHTMNEEQIRLLIAESTRPLQESVAALTTENTRLREAIALREAGDFIRRHLANIALPEITKARLTESLVNAATLKDGALDTAALTVAIEAAVKAEGDYLAAVTGGVVRGVGAAVQEAAAPKPEELAGKFQALFGLSEAAAKLAAEGRV